MDDFFTGCDIFSRAVDDDDDDDEEIASSVDDDDETESSSIFVPSKTTDSVPDVCMQCSTLVITIGSAASGFADAHLLSKQLADVVGVVQTGMEQPAKQMCTVWRVCGHPDTFIAMCPIDVKAEQTFSLTQQLLSAVCTSDTKVFVLTTVGIANYLSILSPGDLPDSFVRSLATRKCCTQAICPSLEQPNLITGLAAQVASYCEVKGISCLLLVCYTKMSTCNTDVMKEFQRVLQRSPLQNIVHEMTSSKTPTLLCGTNTVLFI
jgi:proteasome assembly chaperone 1